METIETANERRFSLRLTDVLSGKIHRGDAAAFEENEDDDQTLTCVSFSLNNGTFALSVEQIQEVIGVDEIVGIPGASGAAEGVMKYREEVLPVVDIRKKIGIMNGKITEVSRVLVTRINDIPIGFLVDNVSKVINLNKNDIQKESSMASDAAKEIIQGIVNNEDGIVMLLNFSTLLSHGELQSIQEAMAAMNSRKENAGAVQ